MRKISKKDQHGIFQHYQSEVTDYNTRESLLTGRGGEKPDPKKLYGLTPEHPDAYRPDNSKPGSLSTRYVPGRPGVQALRVSSGVFQDPHTKELFDYNEGFKTSDGRVFNGGSVDLQTDLINLAKKLNSIGLVKESRFLNDSIRKIAGSGLLDPDPCKEVCDILLRGYPGNVNPLSDSNCSKLMSVLSKHKELCSDLLHCLNNLELDHDISEEDNEMLMNMYNDPYEGFTMEDEDSENEEYENDFLESYNDNTEYKSVPGYPYSKMDDYEDEDYEMDEDEDYEMDEDEK